MKHIMKEQWDEMARENAFYSVLSLNDFEDPNTVDISKFWEIGRKDVDRLMKVLQRVSSLETTSELSMVEIGCGLGRMTHYFAELFSKVYALDVSPEMLSQAKSYWRHLQNVEWIHGNGEDLHQIASGTIDFVFSFLVLQHIPDPRIVINYIRESERVMKKGGIALLQFRTLPRKVSLAGLKYYVSTRWPSSMANFIRNLWDLMNGHRRTAAKFARQYESWRGCVLRPALIENVASEIHLQVQHRASLSKQYTYYIFRKAGGP